MTNYDELIKALRETHDRVKNNPELAWRVPPYQLSVAADVIEELTSADVREVTHGKWVKATGMMPPEYCGLHICSECGHYAGRKPPYGGRELLSDYCPSCGARMDKEE